MGSPLSQTAQFPIDVVVGPEFVTGSQNESWNRTKISVKHDFDRHNDTTRQSEGNKMVDMQLSNTKLVDRGVK
jgi:N-acetylmuramic acid 6-phosphate etherase